MRKKGQITLPLSMRKKLGIGEGSIILSKIVDDTIVLIPQEMIDRFTFEFGEARTIILRVVGPHDPT